MWSAHWEAHTISLEKVGQLWSEVRDMHVSQLALGPPSLVPAVVSEKGQRQSMANTGRSTVSAHHVATCFSSVLGLLHTTLSRIPVNNLASSSSSKPSRPPTLR